MAGPFPTDPYRRCTAIRRDGQPCRGPATCGDRCFAHAPGMAEQRRSARERGGRNSAKLVRLHGLLPPRLAPIFDRLEGALVQLHDGDLAPAQATAMAAVSRALVAVLSAGELEARLREVEAAMKARGET